MTSDQSSRRDAHRAPSRRPSVEQRAAMHAALGEPVRLAIVDELASSDRSPKELGTRFGIPSNLLTHHLDVLEEVGLILRSASAGDGRRKYVRLVRGPSIGLDLVGRTPKGDMLFLCRHNSARSQLAAALWTARTGRRASSAGSDPAPEIHPGAVRAARRAGLTLDGRRPRPVGRIPARAQVVTVCDIAHEDLEPDPDWWHWSIPDPAEQGTDRAFDAVVRELDERISTIGIRT